MKSLKQTLIFGFLSWLIPLIISFAVFPIHDSNRPLFESVMAVAVAGTVAWLAALYCRKDRPVTIVEGLVVASIWVVINLAFDYFVLIRGPVGMGLEEYFYDIGVMYILLLLVVPAVAWAASRSKVRDSAVLE